MQQLHLLLCFNSSSQSFATLWVTVGEAQCHGEKCVQTFIMLLHCPQSINRGAKYSDMSLAAVRGLKDLLHAVDLVPCVEVFEVEEVQQYLWHVFILIDDILEGTKSRV